MRRVLIELRAASGSPWSFALIGLAWLAMAGAAVFLVVRHRCCWRQGLLGMDMLFAMAAYFVTLSYGGLVPMMLADLRQLRIPGRLCAHVGMGIAALLLVTVVIPAAALGFVQRSADPVLLIASAALGGLLLVRLPRPLGVTLALLAVLVLVAAARWGNGGLGRLVLMLDPHAQRWLYFALLSALVAWLWRPVLRGDGAALETAARRAAAWRVGPQSASTSMSTWSSGWFPTVAGGNAPAPPVRVVRICLGPLYLLDSRAALRLLAQAAVPLAVFVGQFVWMLGWRAGWRASVLVCLLLIWFAFGLHVRRTLQRAGGDLAELALLPGLGDRDTQRRALWNASVTTPLALSAVVIALALLAGRAESPALTTSLELLEWLGAATLIGLAFMASVLARRTDGWLDWTCLLSLVVALAFWVLSEAGRRAPAAWTGLPVIAGLIFTVNARRLQAMPHPFVVRG